jgi:site-specific DNA-cytosine methylase
LNVVELYCGSATITKAFKERGHNTCSIDIRKRKGKCEPDIRADIGKLSAETIVSFLGGPVDAVWCSFPCTVFSYAAGDHHFKDGDPHSEEAFFYIDLLKKTFDLIIALNPQVYWIENPRGRLRYQKQMIDFITRNNGMIKELTYGSYDYPYTKPTNLFTNCHDYQPRPMIGYGRGHKSQMSLKKLTVNQAQQIPQALAAEIADFTEKKVCRRLPESVQLFLPLLYKA